MNSSISLATLAHLLAHARSSQLARSHTLTPTCTLNFSCPSHAKTECQPSVLSSLSPSHTRRCPRSGTLLSRILSCYSRMLPLHAQPLTPAQQLHGRQPTPPTRTQLCCHVRNTASTCHTLTLVSLPTNSTVEESNLYSAQR